MAKNVEFFIATDGNDANPGTKEKPFRSLEAARDAIRRLKKENAENMGFTVFLSGGVYCRESARDMARRGFMLTTAVAQRQQSAMFFTKCTTRS